MLVDLKPMVGVCSINIISLLDSPSQLFSTSQYFRTDLVSMSYFGPYSFFTSLRESGATSVGSCVTISFTKQVQKVKK